MVTSTRGRIEVSAAPKDGLVEVSVSDTGIGIAPDDQARHSDRGGTLIHASEHVGAVG
jgi:signal transduction histidine kinase